MSTTIGVFDSGTGGLTVLQELSVAGYKKYIYIGDTLRAPYGNKTKEELLSCTKDLLRFLQKKNVDIFVSACNSLSTLDIAPILEELGIAHSKYFDMTMFGEAAVSDIPPHARVLIYATQATIQTGVYQNIFEQYSPEVLVSTSLAKHIEENNHIGIDEDIDVLIDYLIEHAITHVFLGCTHYPLIQDYIDKRSEGMGVVFINPATYIHTMFHTQEESSSHMDIFFTKITEQGQHFSEEMFGVAPVRAEL